MKRAEYSTKIYKGGCNFEIAFSFCWLKEIFTIGFYAFENKLDDNNYVDAQNNLHELK